MLTPSGRKLLFQRYRVDSDVAIFRINVDGTGRRELTKGSINVEPAWSPDGGQIAFISNRDGNKELYAMNVDGGSQTRLTNTPEAEESSPAW
jgi:Tol biopolymer transport system component